MANDKILEYKSHECPVAKECENRRCWLKQVSEGASIWVSDLLKGEKGLSEGWVEPELRFRMAPPMACFTSCKSYIGPNKDLNCGES